MGGRRVSMGGGRDWRAVGLFLVALVLVLGAMAAVWLGLGVGLAGRQSVDPAMGCGSPATVWALGPAASGACKAAAHDRVVLVGVVVAVLVIGAVGFGVAGKVRLDRLERRRRAAALPS